MVVVVVVVVVVVLVSDRRSKTSLNRSQYMQHHLIREMIIS